VSAAPGQQTEEVAMAGGRIRQGEEGFKRALAQEGDDQFAGADIEAGTNFCGLFHGVI
jgi:hypothetical protein